MSSLIVEQRTRYYKERDQIIMSFLQKITNLLLLREGVEQRVLNDF
jgi:hypothetical protein